MLRKHLNIRKCYTNYYFRNQAFSPLTCHLKMLWFPYIPVFVLFLKHQVQPDQYLIYIINPNIFNIRTYFLSILPVHLEYCGCIYGIYWLLHRATFQLLAIGDFPSYLSLFLECIYPVVSSPLPLKFLFCGPQIENEILGLSSVYHCLNAWRWWVKQTNQWYKSPVHCSYCQWCSLWLFKA